MECCKQCTRTDNYPECKKCVSDTCNISDACNTHKKHHQKESTPPEHGRVSGCRCSHKPIQKPFLHQMQTPPRKK